MFRIAMGNTFRIPLFLFLATMLVFTSFANISFSQAQETSILKKDKKDKKNKNTVLKVKNNKERSLASKQYGTPYTKRNSSTSLPPDIVVIMTDDQRAGTERAMPYTWDFFNSERGVYYPNTQVPTNLCCPGRAAFLSGLYPTRTNVWDNGGAFGGWATFKTFENETIVNYLKYKSYTTGLFGKMMNGFPGGPKDWGYTPPGWDSFYVFEGPKGADYRGNIRGIGAGTYSTDTLGDAAVKFIRQADPNTPLFTYYTPFAPHAPFDAGPYRHSTSKSLQELGEKWGGYRNPSYNYVGKNEPNWMKRTPKLREEHTQDIVRKQMDTLQGVDANVKKIVRAIAETRNIDNTMFVFMSDNGYAWGDFTLYGKRHPFIAANEIPLLIKYPNSIDPGITQDDRLTNNVDITATILDVAGVPRKLDGQSIISTTPRETLPLMAAATTATTPRTIARPGYCGLRTSRYFYLEYTTGEVQLNDLAKDSWQLNNLAGDPGYKSVQDSLHDRLGGTSCDLNYLKYSVEPNLTDMDE